jgi:hypothetical protein
MAGLRWLACFSDRTWVEYIPAMFRSCSSGRRYTQPISRCSSILSHRCRVIVGRHTDTSKGRRRALRMACNRTNVCTVHACVPAAAVVPPQR